MVKILLLPILLLGLLFNLPLPLNAESPRPQEFRGSVIVNGNPTPQSSTVTVRTGGIQIASVATDAKGRYGFSSPLLVSASSGALLEFYVNGAKARETANCKSGEITLLNLTVDPGSVDQNSTLSGTQPAIASSTGNYTISNLSVSPTAVKPGELVTITAYITNSSGSASNYKVTVAVNGVNEIEQALSLGPGKTQKVMYTISKENAGTYDVAVNNQNGSFSVATSGTSWFAWLTGGPWWMYTIAGIGILFVILIIILLISRRNSGYF
jgi:hypothetical protein